MKRNIFIAFTIVAAFILQSTVGKWIAFGGICPNLIVILVAAYGFMCGSSCGLLTGFFAGVLYDMYFGSVPGLYAFLLMYIGFMNGTFKQIFFKEDIKLPLILIMFSDIVCGLFCYILQFLLRGRLNFPHYLFYVILPEMVYTVLVTMIVYPPVRAAVLKLDDDMERGREESHV